LSDSLTRKYADTDKPHVRITEQVIDPRQLDFIDYVTSSHNHTDHLDPETLKPLFQANPNLKIICPRANREMVQQRTKADETALIDLNDGETTDLGDGIKVHGIAAAHNELKTDEGGNHHFMGFVAEWGKYFLYHSGDSLLYPGLEERLKFFNIDLAFLPINGNKPERRVAGNFNAQEAVDLAKATGIQCVIPCHYDMFEFNTVAPDEFIEYADQQQCRSKVMLNGEGWTL